jgi:O-antigen/teichoic acid export membrane protein
LGWLLAASIFTNGLLNAGPVVVKALADADEVGAAGAFLNGLIIARIPLFFYQAVQASLLPQLAGLVGSGDHDEFRRVLYRLVAAVVAIGTVGVVGAALVGPVVVEVVFDDDLSSRDMALLAGAAAVFMLAMSFAQALIAMRRQARVALGWLIGVIAFAVVVAAGSDLFLRVELGLLAGAGAASVAMFVLLPSRPAARPEPAEAPVQPSPSI